MDKAEYEVSYKQKRLEHAEKKGRRKALLRFRQMIMIKQLRKKQNK